MDPKSAEAQVFYGSSNVGPGPAPSPSGNDDITMKLCFYF